MNKIIPKLDFLVVASARSGTTWLYLCLKDHPQICLSNKKEYIPFDDQDNLILEGFEKQFAHCQNPEALRGIMPVFFNAREGSSLMIKKYWPKAKIVMLLRNPMDRSYDQYLHNSTRGMLPGVSFSQSIKQKSPVLDYSMYGDAVETYIRDFDRENVLIIFHNDMMKDHAGTLRLVQKFLGIEPRSSEYIDSFISVARESRKYYRYEFLFQLHKRLKQLSALAQKIGGNWVKRALKALRLGKVLSFIYHLNFDAKIDSGKEDSLEEVKMSAQDREYLRQYFAQDIAKLVKVLGRDPHWS